MSITHVVLFQFKSSVTAEVINDVCSRMLALKDDCLHPLSQKPYIKSSSGGIDNSIEGIQNAISHAFVVEFSSAADREYYVRNDPVHQEFIQSVGGLLEKAQVIDFTDGIFEN
ncbi:stress responsive A/B barrel domain protein [Penicillium argentinense]|uniref:Stress responsive A/B barrel domain protein n=1 Tax=Penicillium argentinense TaxID=1131581 RepID=A0A9W9EWU6_9EURO|nr:stress responsive A/B barrel domain protein [Penicillium argentinense]KAJ5089478.1 stress responsive A/B barrel domain protein [Penicillium argentinense]